MDETSAVLSRQLTDARPETRTSGKSTWRDAINRRQEFADHIQKALDGEGIQALITRSANGTYPVWLRVEAWMPAEAAGAVDTDPRVRTVLQIVVDITPFHESRTTVSATADNGKRRISVSSRPDFSAAEAVEWALFAVGRGGSPSNYQPVVDAIATILFAMIPGIRGPHENRVRRDFRNVPNISVLTVMVIIGAVLAFVGGTDLLEPSYAQVGWGVPLLLLGGAVLLAAVVIYSRRQRVISVIERPDIPPRELLMVDSWHAVIPKLGLRFSQVKDRIASRLAETASMTTEPEIYGFRTPNGYEERERLVVSKGQGVAHVHIYQFGEDIFIGWDSYLNWAKWGETSAVSSRTEIRRLIEFRSLKEELYIPNQFDLIDLNTLIEVVHRKVSEEVKSLMKEHDIDQEIDFHIIRGDRDLALDKDRFDRTTKSRGEEKKRSARTWRIS